MALPTLQELQSKFNGKIIEYMSLPENSYVYLDENITIDKVLKLANEFSNVLLVKIIKINTFDIEAYEYYKDKPYILELCYFINNQLFAIDFEDKSLMKIKEEIDRQYLEKFNAQIKEKEVKLDNLRKEFAQILKQDKNFMSLTNNTARQAYIKKEYEEWSHKAGAYFNKEFVEFYNLYIK